MNNADAAADFGHLPRDKSLAGPLSSQQREFAQVIGREIARTLRQSRQDRENVSPKTDVASPTAVATGNGQNAS